MNHISVICDWAVFGQGTQSLNSCCSEALKWPSPWTTTAATQRPAVPGSSDVWTCSTVNKCAWKRQREQSSWTSSIKASPQKDHSLFSVQLFNVWITWRSSEHRMIIQTQNEWEVTDKGRERCDYISARYFKSTVPVGAWSKHNITWLISKT